MEIRPANVGDVAAAPDWLAGIDLRADQWRDDATRAIVGTEDGIPTISFDGHDTDPHFRPLLDELPVSGEAFELLEWG